MRKLREIFRLTYVPVLCSRLTSNDSMFWPSTPGLHCWPSRPFMPPIRSVFGSRTVSVLPRSPAHPAFGGPMTLAGHRIPFTRPTFAGVITTTIFAAPVPRVATCTLTETIGLSSLLCIGATGSHVPHQSLTLAHVAFIPSADFAHRAFQTPSGVHSFHDGTR